MVIERLCDVSRVISLSDKLFWIVLLTVLCSINAIQSVDLQVSNGKRFRNGGHFLGEGKAGTIAVEANVRLAEILCNYTTKTNCLYAEQQELPAAVKDFLYAGQQNANEVPATAVISATEQGFGAGNAVRRNSSNTSLSNKRVREKRQQEFFNFNWIFELLACMMLASAFEICLLILRNLRNFSLAIHGFWSALNTCLQNLCKTCDSSSSSNKNDQQRQSNVAMGEKRTLSYIFAILTWRASQTAKENGDSAETNLRAKCEPNATSYGHVTTMGDLLLLILFTHVYYQRQKFHQGVRNDVDNDSERLLKDQNCKEQSRTVYNKFYDKQDKTEHNNTFDVESYPRRSSSKRCSHFCGNMYQQMSSLQENKAAQDKLATLTSYATRMPYLTHCTGIIWHTCCFCQYSCPLCCYCCSNCGRFNQRCYIRMPLYNTLYCCCIYKNLKTFRDVTLKHSCFSCCRQDFCNLNISNTPLTCHSCCHLYCGAYPYNHCCLCNTLANETPVRAVNLFLLDKMRNSGFNVCSPSTVCYNHKLLWNNNKSYCALYKLVGETYSPLYMTDSWCMPLNKRSYYLFVIGLFNTLMPQHLLAVKNCQTFLKWRKLHMAMVVMALIVICASNARTNYSHHHYCSSLLNRWNKHFSKCRQNSKRRRRRRRHQHCKAYRPQHYFYTTLIQCVKRQNAKKIHKKLSNKLHKKSADLITASASNYEQFLAPSVTPTKAPMVRAIKRVRGSKPNFVWLLIGLIWFEGPKMVNCNVIINYQNQQQHEPQHPQQQPAGNNRKETVTDSANSNFEYKIENFNQVKTKSSNNNSNSNNNNNNSNNNIINSSNNENKNNHTNSNINTKNKNKISGKANDINMTKNSNRSASRTSSNINLSVSFIPIINNIHFKHYCNRNYHQKLIRSSQRVQRALKTNTIFDTSITSSASPNFNNVNDELNLKQMPPPSFQSINEESHVQSDLMRLESIKHQILFKLGLSRKPNVSHPLPKQFIWDTIYRADGMKSFHELTNTNNLQDHHHLTTQRNVRYWPSTASKASSVVPTNNVQQRQDWAKDSYNSKGNLGNIKRSLEGINVIGQKYVKNEQRAQKHEQTHSKDKNNNNYIIYQNGATAISASKTLNQLLYITTNPNNLVNYTNKTVNNFTISKQPKHEIHKNSPHSTITSKKTTIHQQNRRQHEQINQHTNNNDKNTNNNYNNNDNVNSSNNKNNIIMVQKHLRSNNKYNEETKKFTYLKDINNSSDNSLNSMEEHSNPDSDDNNSILRKPTHYHHYQHHNDYVVPKQLQQKHHATLNEKTIENYQPFNIEDMIDADDDVTVDRNFHLESGDDDDVEQYYRQNRHRHDNYISHLNAFDDNDDDFFGSTQEIITFAERGKMYKNHRLVEFSHQTNDKPKQKLHVQNAEIHIRIDKIPLKNKSRAGSGIKRRRLKIWIFQLIENNYTYEGFDQLAQFCASFEVDTSRLGWQKFDITTTVKEWYSQREGEKLRLLIDCTGCGKLYSVHLFNNNNVNIRDHRVSDKRRSSNPSNINRENVYNVTHNDNYTNFQNNQTQLLSNKDNYHRINSISEDNSDEEDVLNSSRPFLVLHTESRRQRRVRRRAINCNGALHGQCCKESFYVSFKALGWDDWIIAPRGYFANYCRGDCTGPYRTPDTFQTFHAHFIEEYRKMGLLNGMQPCCAPIKFSSMSLIYYGDEGIIKRDLPKMVVDECGCP